PQLLGLTTNAALIRDAGGTPTVEYLGEAARVPPHPQGVQFLGSAEAEALRAAGAPHPRLAGGRRLRAVAGDTRREQAGARPGGLSSLCRAIGVALDRDRPNAVVAAVAIQALRRTRAGDGDDTLAHLRQLFATAYSKSDGDYIPQRLRELAAT